MPQINNEHWRLKLTAQLYRAHLPEYKSVACKCGRGSMFCIPEDEYCHKCKNSGIANEEISYPPKPEIPESLYEFMKMAWEEYVSLSENEVAERLAENYKKGLRSS